MVKIMEIPIKMDDLGVPPFSEPPIFNPCKLVGKRSPKLSNLPMIGLQFIFDQPRLGAILGRHP